MSPINRKDTKIEDEGGNRSLIDDRSVDVGNNLTDMNLVENNISRSVLNDITQTHADGSSQA